MSIRYPLEWPNLIGTGFAHREAGVLAALGTLDRALAKQKVTHAGLRQAILAPLAAITERGPEAIGPRQGGVD